MSYPLFQIEARGAWLTFRHVSAADSPDSLAWLTEVGALRSVARAAHPEGVGATEAPSLSVSLDNANGQAFRLLGLPLRCRARLLLDGETVFDGLVARITHGVTLGLEIEA